MTVKKKKAPDRRVARTQTALREALVTLILEQGWDSITVQDVCDRANVGRSTFYAHFTNKEKLLISGFDELHKMLRAQAKKHAGEDASILHFAGGLIQHVHEYKRLFRAVVGKRSGIVVQRRFRQLLLTLVEEDLPAGQLSELRREAAAHSICGTLFELLNWWIDKRSTMTPQELEALFHEFTAPIVAKVMGSE